jgi:hypothetical protein
VKKTTALFEDTEMAYNRWVQGIASREQSSSKTSLASIFNANKAKPLDNEHPPENKPLHPVLEKTPEIVGCILLDLANLDSKIKVALNSNMARDPKKKEILNKLAHITQHNKRMTKRLIKYFKMLT